MIETSSNLLRSSSTIFGKFSKMSGICSKRFVRPSQLFWKIFGKWSEIFGKSPETLSSAWLYKRTLHVSSKICLCSYGNNNRFTCSLRSLVRWMNEWMCIFVPHISHIVSRRFAILLSEIERQLVKAPLAIAIGSYLISLAHPTHAWNLQWNYR